MNLSNSNDVTLHILWLILLSLAGCDGETRNISEVTSVLENTSGNATTSSATITTLVIGSETGAAMSQPRRIGPSLILCECRPGEVMEVGIGQCQPLTEGTTTTVPLEPPWGANTTEPEQVNTAEMNVTVMQPQCGYKQVVLQEDQFHLQYRDPLIELRVTKGDWMDLIVVEYCIHHERDGDEQVKVSARGCVSKPIIPRCCKAGTYMENNKCINTAYPSLPLKPKLTIGFQGGQFPYDDRDEIVAGLNCTHGYAPEKIWLDGNKAFLAASVDLVGLAWVAIYNKWQFREPPNYCVDGAEHGYTYYAYTCVEDLDVLCQNKQCLHQCCEDWETISREGCVASEIDIPRSPSPNYITPFVGYPPACYGKPMINLKDFKLLSDASLYYTNEINVSTTYSFKEFCKYTIAGDNFTEEGVLVCLHEIQFSDSLFWNSTRLLNPITIGLSSAFLALLILMYSRVPKLMEHEGRHHLYHAASLFLYYTVSGSLQVLLKKDYVVEQTMVCVIAALLMQFGSLSAYFWLNVMCFDEWRLFSFINRNSRISTLEPNKQESEEKLQEDLVPHIASWIYILYALGGPLIISCTTIIVQFWGPRDGSIPWLVHPSIGDMRCWFGHEEWAIEEWAYYYGPIAILCLLNIIFIATSYHYLRMIRRDYTSDTDQSGDTVVFAETKRKYEYLAVFWQRFFLLVLVTGFWLTDILSIVIQPKELWAITDLLNNLQGVFIFFIFLTHERKRALLKEQLPKLLTFTNAWIDQTDEARADIHNTNKKIAKRLSLNDYILNIISESSYDLNVDDPDSITPSEGGIPLSILLTGIKPLNSPKLNKKS